MRMRLVEVPAVLSAFKERPIYGLIWTTTPWTLVANQAVAYSPNINYCLVEDNEGNLYIIAADLLEKNIEKIGQLSIVTTFVGR